MNKNWYTIFLDKNTTNEYKSETELILKNFNTEKK